MIDRFDVEKYKQIMLEITSGEHFSPTTATIWNMQQFDFNYFDFEMARTLTKAREAFTLREGAMIAYVVSNQLGFGMMRMFQVMTETEDTSKVFFNYNEGLQWLLESSQHFVNPDTHSKAHFMK